MQNIGFNSRPKVLVIAGSDSSCGAGIQADNKVIDVFACEALNIVTAITAQNQSGVHHVQPVSLESLDAQWVSILAEDKPDVIKIGMLGSVEAILWLEGKLAELHSSLPEGAAMPAVVLDPVLSATQGGQLFNANSTEALAAYESLLKYVSVLTPNHKEFISLYTSLNKESNALELGLRVTRDSLLIAAEEFAQRYDLSLLLTGGESRISEEIEPGVNSSNVSDATDYAVVGELPFSMTSSRIVGLDLHGTGCAMASAIAASLALGYSEFEAFVLAKAYLQQGFVEAERLGLMSEQAYPNFVHTHFPNNVDDFPHVRLLQDEAQETNFPEIDGELGLYPVVDSIEWLDRCLQAGVGTIQLRVKDASGDELDSMVAKAAQLGRQYQAKLFINDYWELAIKHNAYGVHLGQEDVVDADLKAIEAAGLKLGLSTHSWFELLRAHSFKPSYIAIGPIYETTTKQMPWRPQGLENLSTWLGVLKQSARHYPVVAIGGINASNAEQVLSTGVGSIAMVRAITEAENYQQAINQLNVLIKNAISSANSPH